MSGPIDPNGFRDDVQAALERVRGLDEGDELDAAARERRRRDKEAILEYFNSVHDEYAPGTLRTRIGRVRTFAEEAPRPLLEIERRKRVTTVLGRMSRERDWSSVGTKRNYLKALAVFYAWHERDALAEAIREYVREQLDTQGTAADAVDDEQVVEKATFDALLRAAETARERALLALLWEGSYRVTALVALRVGDYDCHGDEYAIVTTPEAVGDKDAAGQQKPLTWARGYVDNWLETDHPCPDDEDAALICVVRNSRDDAGDHLSTQYVRRLITEIAERAEGVDADAVTPHGFRHGRATTLRKREVPDHLIEQNLDWAENSSQHKRYEHLEQTDRVAGLLQHAGVEPPDEATVEDEQQDCPRCQQSILAAARFCPHCSLRLDDAIPDWWRLYSRAADDDDALIQEFGGQDTVVPPLHELPPEMYQHVIRQLFAIVGLVLADEEQRKTLGVTQAEAIRFWQHLKETNPTFRHYQEYRLHHQLDDEPDVPVEQYERRLATASDDDTED